jgi:hypothetical protein
MKPDINSVEVHPQLSHNGHPMDGVLVGTANFMPHEWISWETSTICSAINKIKGSFQGSVTSPQEQFLTGNTQNNQSQMSISKTRTHTYIIILSLDLKLYAHAILTSELVVFY